MIDYPTVFEEPTAALSPSPVEPRCAGCRYWVRWASKYPQNMGECQSLLTNLEVPSEDYFLSTQDIFGCVHFEPKEA